jgi:hypothetical protein
MRLQWTAWKVDDPALQYQAFVEAFDCAVDHAFEKKGAAKSRRG